MLAVTAIEGHYQSRRYRDGYKGITNLSDCARTGTERALNLPHGPTQREALIEAGGLCLAARDRARNDLAHDPTEIERLLHRIYDALFAYERIPEDIAFESLHGSRDDRERYRTDVVPGMSAEDVHADASFFERVNDGRLIAWWLTRGDAVIGWCALAPDHGRYRPGAYHLYGSWVSAAERRKGYARLMWLYRMHIVPRLTPITVSVQDGKTASLRLAKRLGFRPIGKNGPWTTYLHDH